MTDPNDRPDDDLARLLAAERSAEAPSDALARVGSRLGLALPVTPLGAVKPAAPGFLAAHALPVAVAAFVAGGVTGAAVYATVQKPPPERIVYTERAAPPVATAEAHAPAPPPSAPLPSPPPTLPRPRASAPPPAESLQTERVALDHARSLLAEGNAADALAALDAHARTFAASQLGEEREALAIQALVALHRYDEARARGARFHASVPNSLFAPVIDAALAAIP